MDWSSWLKGGPFLEVSFLMKYEKNSNETIREVIDKLSRISNRIVMVDDNVEEVLKEFATGYLYDEEDPHSIRHSLRLGLYIYLPLKRKSTLQIEIVSSNSMLVNFWFFGADHDVKEWDQVGVKEEDFKYFTIFLCELFSIYQFKVGAIAFEQDVLEVFGSNETYPNEAFEFEKVTPSRSLEDLSSYVYLLWNETYHRIKNINYEYERLRNNGILIKTGSYK